MSHFLFRNEQKQTYITSKNTEKLQDFRMIIMSMD